MANELTLEGVLAITGSNMSGKSTFLRAVGVNALLAQALGFACADRYQGPLLRLATSLRVADDLGKGQSTYLAEARRLKAMLEEAAGGRTLFLLDEPFRGTNSPERIAAAVALLRHLRREGHLAIAATHDLEVASTAASDGMASAHFADGVTAEGLSFDHQLRPGVSREHNALKLLEVLGLPAAMVAEARAYAKERG